MALYNLNQAYIGLKEEEEGKEQVKLLGDYVQSVLVGENPFTKEKERQENGKWRGKFGFAKSNFGARGQLCANPPRPGASFSPY